MDVVLSRLFPRDVVCTILLGFLARDYWMQPDDKQIRRVRRLRRARLAHCAATFKRCLRFQARQTWKTYELNWMAVTLPPHFNMLVSEFCALQSSSNSPVATSMQSMLRRRHDVHPCARILGYYRLVLPAHSRGTCSSTIVKIGYAIVYHGVRHFQTEWFISVNGVDTMTPSSFLPLRKRSNLRRRQIN